MRNLHQRLVLLVFGLLLILNNVSLASAAKKKKTKKTKKKKTKKKKKASTKPSSTSSSSTKVNLDGFQIRPDTSVLDYMDPAITQDPDVIREIQDNFERGNLIVLKDAFLYR